MHRSIRSVVVVFLVRIAGGKHFTASVFPSIILIIVARAGLLLYPAILLWVRLLLLLVLHPEIVSIGRVSKVLLLVMSIAVLLVLILVPNHKWSTVRLWVNSMSNSFHNRLEAVPFISFILNVPLGAVRFIQWEISDGHGGLKGGYTLDEPDGTKRYVQYTADKWHGFQAIVKRIGHAIHPQSYGTAFVVQSTEKAHQKNGNGYGFEEQSNGNGFGLQNHQSYAQQQNGWVDQQASSSGNGNGWNNGNGKSYATSYVKQKSYY